MDEGRSDGTYAHDPYGTKIIMILRAMKSGESGVIKLSSRRRLILLLSSLRFFFLALCFFFL